MIRRATGILAVALLAALLGCGGEASNDSTRQQRGDVGDINDNTQLADGVNQRREGGADAEPARPLVRDVALHHGYAFALVPDALLTVSIENPDQPEVVGRQVLAKTPVQLAIDGVTAYVACAQGGVQVLGIGQPRTPQVVGAYAPEAGAVTRVAAANGLLLAGIEGSGVAVVDVADPSKPTERKLIPLKGPIRGLAIHEQRGYVVGDELTILDLAKPAEAAVAGTYKVKEHLRAVVPVGAYTLLIADEWSHLLNLRSPQRPLRTAELATAALVKALGEAAAAVTASDGGGANAAAAIATVAGAEAKPTAEPVKPAAETAPASTAVVSEARLVGNFLYLIRGPQVYLIEVKDGRALAPLLRLADLPGASAVGAEAATAVVAQGTQLVVFTRDGATATRRGSVKVGEQATVKEAAGGQPTVPVSAGAKATMEATPEPRTERPADAPPAGT